MYTPPPPQGPYPPHGGYGPPAPPPNPWAYGPPPPTATGVPTGVWVGLGVGVLLLMGLGVVFVAVAILGARSASRHDAAEPGLPTVHRDVPVHDASIFDGCSKADITMIDERIGDAIDVGAPTYNTGDFQGCYTTYDRAAVRLEATLSPSCKGPKRALATGRAKAQGLLAPADKAWAMRDAFDGLLHAIEATEGH